MAAHSQRRYALANSLQGFPITLGLAAAFTLAFFVVPIRKFQALMRGEKSEHLPLVVESKDRARVDRVLLSALSRMGLPVESRPVPRLDRAIAAILRATRRGRRGSAKRARRATSGAPVWR